MAQRIVTLCDAHAAHDEEVPGVTWVVTLGGRDSRKPTTWEVDLCPDDGKTLEDLATMLGAVGRVVDGPRKPSKAPTAARRDGARPTGPAPLAAPQDASGGYPCPMCEKVSRNRKSLMSHLRANHDGMSLAEAMGQPLPFPCPDCQRKFSHATGLGAHRRAAHGVPGAGSAAG